MSNHLDPRSKYGPTIVKVESLNDEIFLLFYEIFLTKQQTSWKDHLLQNTLLELWQSTTLLIASK